MNVFVKKKSATATVAKFGWTVQLYNCFYLLSHLYWGFRVSATTLSIITSSITTLSIVASSITTLSIMTFCITTFSIAIN